MLQYMRSKFPTFICIHPYIVPCCMPAEESSEEDSTVRKQTFTRSRVYFCYARRSCMYISFTLLRFFLCMLFGVLLCSGHCRMVDHIFVRRFDDDIESDCLFLSRIKNEERSNKVCFLNKRGTGKSEYVTFF